MTVTFEDLKVGDTIEGPGFAVTRESIRLLTRKAIRLGMLDLIRPVTTLAWGRWVARIR